MLGAWGVLPVAVWLLVFVTRRLTRLVFRGAGLTERVAGAVVIGMGVVHLSVGWLGAAGVLSRLSLLGLLAIAAGAVAVATRRLEPAPSPRLAPSELAIVASVGVVALLAIVTARILPIWQWDSLGYHLPFVHFVLQSGSFAAVPSDVRYISTYPHDIELAMVWLRAMLPDDRLVDLAQIPFGLAGAALSAAIARRLGANRPLALLSGAAWLAAPGVFLQLPTNYVDVGTATALLAALFFLLLSPLTARNLVFGGIALGLFLGSKPSAPLATAFLASITVFRSIAARRGAALGLFVLAVAVFGGEMYAVMLLRHGNPVWPVEVHLGPWALPGEHSVDALLAAGAATPRAQGNLLERVTLSWLAIDSQPVFDMRLGGFGLLFLVALPAALLGLVRRRSAWLVLALVATVLSPDPAVTRYVLAMAAVVFAVALSEISRVAPRLTPWVVSAVLLIGAWQLDRAWPGLVGDGPPWSDFWAMTDDERRAALGPDGPPTEYASSWAKVKAGESVAFDVDFEFPGLMWEPALRYPVHLVPPETGPELMAWLDQRHVRLVAVGPRHQPFVEHEPASWEKLFDCKSTPCAVYVRR